MSDGVSARQVLATPGISVEALIEAR